ncbi:hypothetical protein C1646_775310 [Rhizophagus diaphanus]|nr:hypothetical protein C1646_775310 [Rhizophagus diaphanus] [Rhizophagus sp. MUCL 43196]
MLFQAIDQNNWISNELHLIQQSTRGQDIKQFWHEFYQLYKIIRQKSIIDLEIDQFEVDTKQWIHNVCHPTIGTMNSADVSPYMHVFAQYVPQFMRYLNQKGMILQYFSTSSAIILYKN